jgi:molybdenum cofactor synthesis domain-containing protein
MIKTAGVVIIGNEILSGMVQDRNATFMTKALTLRGIRTAQVAVIPDEVHDIARTVKLFSRRFDLVFTSGGLGPTHDDVTMEGLCQAFRVPLVLDEGLVGMLRERYNGRLTPEKLKIARIPSGADLITDKALKFPILQYRNIYIYPGVPKFLRRQFLISLQNIQGSPAFLAKVYLKEHESDVAPFLNQVVEDHRDIRIGSYPVVGKDRCLLLLTLESQNKLDLDNTLSSLISHFPGGKIVRVEH